MEKNSINLLEQLSNISVVEEVVVEQPMEEAPLSVPEEVEMISVDLIALQQMINIQMEVAKQKMLQGAAQQQELQKLQAVIQQLQGNNAEPMVEIKVEDDSNISEDQTTDTAAVATPSGSYDPSEVVYIEDDDHSYALRDPDIKEEDIPESIASRGIPKKKSRLAERLGVASGTRRHGQQCTTTTSRTQSVPQPQALFINQTALNEQFTLTGKQVQVGGQTLLIAESVAQQQQQQQVQYVFSSENVELMPSSSSTNNDTKPSKNTTLKQMKTFASSFKDTRIKLGFSPSDVAKALNAQCGANYSHETITRFETVSLNPIDMCKMKPVVTEWLKNVETMPRSSQPPELQNPNWNVLQSNENTVLEKSVTDALELLFVQNNWPTSTDVAAYADQLNCDRQAVRTWFRNKRMRDDYPTVTLDEIDNLETLSTDEIILNNLPFEEEEQKFTMPTTMSMAARLCIMTEQELEEFLDNSETEAPSIASKLLTMNEAELTEFMATSAFTETSTPYKIKI